MQTQWGGHNGSIPAALLLPTKLEYTNDVADFEQEGHLYARERAVQTRRRDLQRNWDNYRQRHAGPRDVARSDVMEVLGAYATLAGLSRELLDRYHHAGPAARALIDVAMDARRLGMGPALPRAFLETAAPGCRARREEFPPASFWPAAASCADPADLDSLGQAAENGGLLRDAARPFTQASTHGDPRAGADLIRLLHALDSAISPWPTGPQRTPVSTTRATPPGCWTPCARRGPPARSPRWWTATPPPTPASTTCLVRPSY